MNFLSPFFLLGALAVAGPVFFHLIRRAARERTFFSSVMFLAPTRPRLTQRSRLEHLWLLLLRCLALGLLAIGFARPFWRRTPTLSAPAASVRRMVVLVDVSASMRRTGLWDAAKERAAAALQSAGPGDEAAVLAFSRQTRPLISFEEWKATPAGERRALVATRLAATAPGWEDDHLGDALIAAAEMLADSRAEKAIGGPRQIFLISDLKAGSRLDSLQAFDWPKNIDLTLMPLKALHPTNAGIQLVAEAADTDRLAAPTVRVRVHNAADSGREQFQVGWARPAGGGYFRPPVDLYVPPGQSRVAAVPMLPNPADMRQIALRGDDEDFDNLAYVVPTQKQHWTVLDFGGDAAPDSHPPRFFLERALPDNPHLAVTLVARGPGALVAPADLQAAKVAFVTAALAPETAAALRGRMEEGLTVVFAPQTAAAAPTLGLLLGIPGVTLKEVQPADYAMFGEIDFQHPLFAPFADPHYSDFTKIHVWKYRRLNLSSIPGARALARFDRGDPALVEAKVGSGRLLILLTGWNPEDSQLAVSSKFVPLIAALLELAGGSTDASVQFGVGDAIPLGPMGNSAETTFVRGPDGATVALPAGTAAYHGAVRPGIYQLTTGNRTTQVAVNIAASESRTEPLAADELERYGAPGPRSEANAVPTIQAQELLQAAEAESRQKLWRWLLGATLAVLLIESALAGWTSRRGGPIATAGGPPV
jgi:hypothetical protein